MPDRTPERLQAFRDEYAPERSRRTGWAKARFAILVLGLSVILIVQLMNFSRQTSVAERRVGPSGTAAGHERQLAAHLADRGLPREAISAYRRYLAIADLTDETRAKVCYSVAEVAIDAKDYTTALARLYESELLDPDSSLKENIDRKIVFCLDKMGRTASLRRELRHRSSMRNTSAGRGEDDTWYAFKGVLQAAVVEPFENVRGRVERLYRMEKEQEALDSLMESTLSAQNVRLYLDRIGVGERGE